MTQQPPRSADAASCLAVRASEIEQSGFFEAERVGRMHRTKEAEEKLECQARQSGMC